MRSTMLCVRTVVVLLLCTFGVEALRSAEPKSIADWLTAIDRDYGPKGWGQQHRLTPEGYMRHLDDPGWQTRMLALQAVAKAGEPSVESLTQTLKSGTTPQRIFAAQALGFLGASAPMEPLLEAAKSDLDPAVRLHAVDSLGMRGGADSAVNWEELRSLQQNNDVRKHIAYAIERGAKGIEPATIARLKNWDPALINTAKVGQPAPEFELVTATDQKVRLSDFRGQKAVVLVFVYGDTCPVCHRYLSGLRQRLAALKDVNAVLLAVDPHEVWAAKALLKETGFSTDDLQYPLLVDPSLTTSAAYGVAMQERIHVEISDRPATFIIDRDGVLRYQRRARTIPDRPTADELIAELRKLN